MNWYRARFYSTSVDDPRPVKFPPPGPWWESGFAGDMSYSVLIAYVNKKNQIKQFWPEAYDVEFEKVEKPVFSDRFPKPEWWKAE